MLFGPCQTAGHLTIYREGLRQCSRKRFFPAGWVELFRGRTAENSGIVRVGWNDPGTKARRQSWGREERSARSLGTGSKSQPLCRVTARSRCCGPVLLNSPWRTKGLISRAAESNPRESISVLTCSRTFSMEEHSFTWWSPRSTGQWGSWPALPHHSLLLRNRRAPQREGTAINYCVSATHQLPCILILLKPQASCHTSSKILPENFDSKLLLGHLMVQQLRPVFSPENQTLKLRSDCSFKLTL